MTEPSFIHNIEIDRGKAIDNDFPMDSRIAVGYLILSLINSGYIRDSEGVFSELFRTGRLTKHDLPHAGYRINANQIITPLQDMQWFRVYIFCERLYDTLLVAAGYSEGDYWIESVPLVDVKQYFSTEINSIMAEDNLAYIFVNGRFQRRGRAHTQSAFRRIGTVLSDTRLTQTRRHYIKARKFFDERPVPDTENCIKEAICSLEDCVQSLTQLKASRDFAGSIRKLQGLNPGQIHPSIAEGIIKLHAYRGGARGVAHAAPDGGPTTAVDAELVLSLVASYVTYLVDLYATQEDNDAPF